MPENPISGFINGLIQAAIAGGEEAVKAYIGVQLPFLEAPIVGLFTNAIIDDIGSHLDSQIAQVVSLVVTEIQVNGEKSTVLHAAQNFKQAQTSGDANAQVQAQAALVEAYSKLVHFDGA